MSKIIKNIDYVFGKIADYATVIIYAAIIALLIYASYRYDVEVVKQGIEESNN